jgi:hypothetical protein
MSQPHPQPPIDVAVIIAALHDQIQQRNHASPNDVSFASEELQDLQDALHEMELTRVISAHLPLKNNGILGRFITMAQKIIRRLLRWYINPIVEQQNMYNDAVMRTMQALVDAYHTRITTTVPPTPPPSAIAAEATADDAQRIQADIAQHEPAIPRSEQALVALVATRQQLMTVRTHWPLPVRKPIDHVANAVHRIQRIGLRWYVNPIVDQMNAHNRTTHTALNRCYTYTTATRTSLELLRNQIPHA